ncbi:MAG: hypothetical protein COT43_03885 [Candidatus Marinimicrobia bacterium CG08_land_8_20_14_0_20_45_22]|nr:MAG: hypothetical protein COT43_03885 [Candidatus Marinimicrobia bacterium CG08_land_8_20_14_0_20_45_22]
MSETETDTLVKIKFSGSRREIYRNPQELPIEQDTLMIVEAERGEDIGKAIPFLTKKRLDDGSPVPLCVLRKATESDLIIDKENRVKERQAFQFCQRRISDLKLPMKLLDVDYRFDRKKIVFFFSAEERVDFRDLVKALASEYKTRIEMKQMSDREEVKRKVSIGMCGNPVCCNLFIDEFEPISTQFVKEQNLPMNPSKISGLCGKLKCCYRFEHETYSEVLKNYPPYGTKVQCEGKSGAVEKIDIFQKTITLKLEDDTCEEIPLTDFNSKIKIVQ